jgi:hypothetical protein
MQKSSFRRAFICLADWIRLPKKADPIPVKMIVLATMEIFFAAKTRRRWSGTSTARFSPILTKKGRRLFVKLNQPLSKP